MTPTYLLKQAAPEFDLRPNDMSQGAGLGGLAGALVGAGLGFRRSRKRDDDMIDTVTGTLGGAGLGAGAGAALGAGITGMNAHSAEKKILESLKGHLVPKHAVDLLVENQRTPIVAKLRHALGALSEKDYDTAKRTAGMHAVQGAMAEDMSPPSAYRSLV